MESRRNWKSFLLLDSPRELGTGSLGYLPDLITPTSRQPFLTYRICHLSIPSSNITRFPRFCRYLDTRILYAVPNNRFFSIWKIPAFNIHILACSINITIRSSNQFYILQKSLAYIKSNSNLLILRSNSIAWNSYSHVYYF